MWKEMRRQDRKLSKEEIEVILKKSEYGILSTVSENGYPYGIPINYVYKDNAIYFHCAHEGHKIENFKYCDKVSFTIVENAEVVAEEFVSHGETVLVFGRVSQAEKEKKEILEALIKKYSYEYQVEGRRYIENSSSITAIYKISIEYKTGKRIK